MISNEDPDFTALVKKTAGIFWPRDDTDSADGISGAILSLMDVIADRNGRLESAEDPLYQDGLRLLASRLEDYRRENGGLSNAEAWLLVYGIAGAMSSENRKDKTPPEALALALNDLYPENSYDDTGRLVRDSAPAIFGLLSQGFQPSPLSGAGDNPHAESFRLLVREYRNVSPGEAEMIFGAVNLLLVHLRAVPGA